jgi:tRNA A37 threonylcarbamoyladenosine synthetase subunit TsaC/SUA5/YrdC
MALASRCNKILTATSANQKDAPDSLNSADLRNLKGVDLIIDAEVPGPPGSTVVDTTGFEPQILRQGILYINPKEWNK